MQLAETDGGGGGGRRAPCRELEVGPGHRARRCPFRPRQSGVDLCFADQTRVMQVSRKEPEICVELLPEHAIGVLSDGHDDVRG